jgi:hypothetical protein
MACKGYQSHPSLRFRACFRGVYDFLEQHVCPTIAPRCKAAIRLFWMLGDEAPVILQGLGTRWKSNCYSRVAATRDESEKENKLVPKVCTEEKELNRYIQAMHTSVHRHELVNIRKKGTQDFQYARSDHKKDQTALLRHRES